MSERDDYLWDRTGAPDPDVAHLEQLLAPLAHARPLDEPRLQRARRGLRPRGPRWIGVAVGAAAAAAVVLYLVLRPGTPSPGGCGAGSGFAFTAQGGAVTCGGVAVATGVLPVGGTLDTGGASAQLAIAEIGRAELSPGTRVRLDRTEANHRHQLHLEHGKLHARVIAPPRMFAVTTPGAAVTDLGCEYTLEIDDAGRGSVTVIDGKVELETSGHVLIVAPAGTSTRLLAQRRPGLPVADSASAALRSAVAAFEADRAGAVDELVTAAGEGDAITLGNLVVLAPVAAREGVLRRLAMLVAPPAGVTIASALADPAQLAAWREAVVVAHLAEQALRGAERQFSPKR